MSDSNKTAPALPTTDIQTAETQMRRALGLNGPSRPVQQQRPEQARGRHRFVQDGGVPVVVLNRSENDPAGALKARVAELEAALEAERTAHAVTKRAWQEAQSAAQALQTRLAHAELAHRDALEVERQTRETVEAALREARAAAERAAAKAPRRKPAETAQAEREPQPVKWWLPNYKAK